MALSIVEMAHSELAEAEELARSAIDRKLRAQYKLEYAEELVKLLAEVKAGESEF